MMGRFEEEGVKKKNIVFTEKEQTPIVNIEQHKHKIEEFRATKQKFR